MGHGDITQSQRRVNGFDIGGRFCILNGFQFVVARFDSIRCEREAFLPEKAFIQVEFQVIVFEPLDNLVMGFEMINMVLVMDEKIINVDNVIDDRSEH